MAADLNLLDPRLKSVALTLQQNCMTSGAEMRPNVGLRDPFEQARLWRQSRSIEEITAKVRELNDKGASFLAHCIESVGAQQGEHVTDTPPGISWHQWGEALDFFWLVDGKAEWSTTKVVNGVNGYKVLAAEAKKLGLTPGGLWPRFKDWPHVQLPPQNNAADVYSLPQIDSQMRTRFSDGH